MVPDFLCPLGPRAQSLLGILAKQPLQQVLRHGPDPRGEGRGALQDPSGRIGGVSGAASPPPQPCPGRPCSPLAALHVQPYSPRHLSLRVPLALQGEGRGPRQQLEEQDAQAPPVHSLPGGAGVRACISPASHPTFPPPPAPLPCQPTLPCPVLLRMISGAMYSMVPQKEKVRSFWDGKRSCLDVETSPVPQCPTRPRVRLAQLVRLES